MMCTEDKMEEMVPSAEEEEKREEEMEENEDGEDEVKEEEAKPQATDKKTPLPVAAKEDEAKPEATDKKTPLPVAPKEKKPDDVLNLNNEVVKMRKEVKRLRALIIRKLTRQIAALKKKKGKETEVESNQRRAARLLEEVHAMKSLSPDLVTKTALQKNLNFEQVCKNPKSNIADRAIARIATHPQFSKKIDSIKAAVKAFKEERMKGGKQGGKGKVQNQAGKATLPLPDKRGGKESQKNNEDKAVEQKEITDGEEGVDARKDTEDATVVETGKKIEKEIGLAGTADIQMQEMPESESVKPASVKSSDVKDTVENKTQNKAAEKKPSLKPAPAAPQKTTADEESDLESSDDEEKEYFDDSTEERFHKQSSQSEESDDDDFFVGKVSTVKKKKKQSDVEGEEKVDKVGKDSTDKVKAKDKLQRELDELQSRLKPKAARLQSAFCSSLAGTKAGGGGGAGGGRGGDNKSRGQGKPKGSSGMNRDFSKPFQKQERGKEKNSGSKYSQLHLEGRRPPTEERGFASADRGRGRGRGGPPRQRDHRGGGFFSHQAPQQALHPSWEASKKRKEQQGQILAFQGKKIKFDDDD